MSSLDPWTPPCTLENINPIETSHLSSSLSTSCCGPVQMESTCRTNLTDVPLYDTPVCSNSAQTLSSGLQDILECPDLSSVWYHGSRQDDCYYKCHMSSMGMCHV